MATNDWCSALGIERPVLESVAHHREANTFALFLVALLERGGPMTLLEVAERFERAGIAERTGALAALKRCRPARPPVYREDDRYHLDPHDDELDLWAFRLGLRGPRVKLVTPPPVEVAPLPAPDVPLTPSELDTAWKNASVATWSVQRMVLAVLDAHGGPLPPAEVHAAVASRTKHHPLHPGRPTMFERRGSAVAVLDDGRWAVATGPAAHEALQKTRAAVRERVAVLRQRATTIRDPAEIDALVAENDRRRAAHGAELARMSRALVVTFPPRAPRAAALLDVGARTVATFVDVELDDIRSRLSEYDIIGGLDIRGALRALAFDPGSRRLAELGPPQKSIALDRGGTLRITTAMLVTGSCGIRRPFGDESKLTQYLAQGAIAKLRARLEADVTSLLALYEYGRLHGSVRLRHGQLYTSLPAPWVHRDEATLYHLKKTAFTANVPLELVVGDAPELTNPWSHARRASVEQGARKWDYYLVGEDRYLINDVDVQRARLAVAMH